MESIATQRLKLTEVAVPYQEILEQAAADLLKSPSSPYRSEEEIPFIRKFYAGVKSETKGLSEGQIRHIITTAALDRDHEILMPKGAITKWYKKNGMVLWSHDYRDPDNIIGRNAGLALLDERRGWEAITQFALKEHKAAKIYRLYKGGFLSMWSVGFIPVKGYRPKPDDDEKQQRSLIMLLGDPPKPDEVRYVHEKWELLEYSAVAVPSNREARTEQVAKDYNLDSDDILLKELCLRMDQQADQIPNDSTVIDLGAITKEGDTKDGEPKEKDKAPAPEAEKSEGESKDAEDEYEREGEIDELLKEEEAEESALPPEFETQEEMDAEYEKAGEADKTAAEMITKPLPNFHACRVRDPKQFTPGSIRTIKRDLDGKPFTILIGRLKGKTSTTVQGYRYPKETWNASMAKAHCKDHDGIKFEAAKAAGDVLMTSELYNDIKSNIEGLREELAEMKAGRTLSAQTRTQITKTIDSLNDVGTAIRSATKNLKQLLEAADPAPDDDDEGEAKITLILGEKNVTQDEEGKTVDLTALMKKDNAVPVIDLSSLKEIIRDVAKGQDPELALKEILDAKKGVVV